MAKIKIKDFLDNYLTTYAKSKNLKGMSTAIANAKPIEKYFGNMKVNQITVKNIVDYKNMRFETVGDNTVRRELSVFRSAINQGINFELFDPFNSKGNESQQYLDCQKLMERISKRKPPKVKRKGIPPREHVKLLMDNSEKPMRQLIFCAYHLLWRKDELLKTIWRDVRFSDYEIVMADSKSGHGRTSFLYEEIYDFLKTMYDDAVERFGVDKVDTMPVFMDKNDVALDYWNTFRRFRTACKKANLVNEDGKPLYVFHQLRSGGVKYLKSKGFNREMVQFHYGGWRSASIMEEIYDTPSSTNFEYYKKLALGG